MSTEQPPSDNDSDGDARSESGQASAPSVAATADPKATQSSSIEERWDPREAPTSSGRTIAGVESAPRPSASGVSPEFRTVPPGVSSSRGKFTVGQLLDAAQGTGPISQKRGESPSVRPRQQIGAVPPRAPARSAAEQKTEVVADLPPLQPGADHAVSDVEVVSRPTPSQPFAIDVVADVEAVSRPTPSQPFAVETGPRVEAATQPIPSRPIASQPLTADVVTDVEAGSRPTPSQPFVVEAVPIAHTATDKGARVERALAPHDLHTPPLIEKTPRGIGVVTLSSSALPPPQPNGSVALESTAFTVAPIVPIAATPALPPVTTNPAQPGAPAAGLDDPEGWDVDVNTATPAISTELHPPVGSGQPRASDREIRVNRSDSSLAAAKRSPSSHSKLARAENSEAGISGEFFAAPDVSVAPTAPRPLQDSDDFIDERRRRSISPEVVARRGRYRIVVVRVIVGFVLLLAAAIALKLLRKH